MTGCFAWKILGKGRQLDKVGSDATGYLVIQIDGVRHRAHRLAFYLMLGEWPAKDLEVDHINGVRTDNRWINLRLVTHAENTKNRRLGKDNKSGAQGVSRYRNGWRVEIGRKYLGHTQNFEEAKKIRKDAEKAHGYHANHGRTA